jgi:hypothetical protein
MGSRAKGKRDTPVRARPPEALVSADVYERLVEYSDAEKRTKRSTARPFGVIAMDAIDRHAEVLASAWEEAGPAVAPPGGLFVRAHHSKFRRHALPAKSISLQGVSAENAEILKKLKNQWGAGSVSDLVERALRIELQI